MSGNSRKRSASTVERQERYDETDLLGIKVSHSESLFKEGEDVILTLKDSEVLDNGEDVLENVSLVDLEKANRNVENKLNKTGYTPFDEPEYDSFGRFKKKGLLSKYDEEINGLKKEAFRIGLDESKRFEQLEEIKKTFAKEKGEISLQLPKYKVASEYFTEEELVSFKKPKRPKKSSKRSTKPAITADDLLPLADENSYNDEDHFSRNRNQFNDNQSKIIKKEDELIDEAFLEHQNLLQNEIKKKIKKSASSLKSSQKDLDLDHRSKRIKKENGKLKNEVKKERIISDEVKKERGISDIEMNEHSESEDDLQIPDEEIYGIALEEDDLQRDLMKSLEKARRIKGKERNEAEKKLEEISETVKSINEDEIKAESSKSITFESRNDIIINSTAEFCRNLGDLSTLKYGKEEEELIDFEKDLLEEKEEQDKMEIDSEDESSYKPRSKWNEVDFKTDQPKTLDLIENKPIILEEEPDVSRGLAGALKLSMKKGYLDKEIKKSNISVKASSLEAKNYTIEGKFREDKINRRERYCGPVSEFKEKSSYKPDVKLEYNDDSGRQLNAKEAFRVLSHKFHGKGPGKNKIDKRMKKLQQEQKLKSMTSIDTPLGTARLLQEKQKELHVPYVILSANQNVLSKKAN